MLIQYEEYRKVPMNLSLLVSLQYEPIHSVLSRDGQPKQSYLRWLYSDQLSSLTLHLI